MPRRYGFERGQFGEARFSPVRSLNLALRIDYRFSIMESRQLLFFRQSHLLVSNLNKLLWSLLQHVALLLVGHFHVPVALSEHIRKRDVDRLIAEGLSQRLDRAAYMTVVRAETLPTWI